mgnify:CR=1 FL=1
MELASPAQRALVKKWSGATISKDDWRICAKVYHRGMEGKKEDALAGLACVFQKLQG